MALESLETPDVVDSNDVSQKFDKLLNPFNQDTPERKKAINGTEFQEFQEFMHSFLKSVRFNIIGSNKVSKETLVDIKARLENIFDLDSSKAQRLPFVPYPFSIQGNFYQVEKESRDGSFVTYFLHLYNSEKIQDFAMAYVATALFSSKCQFQLRTIEQLGYQVKVDLWETDAGGKLVVLVQSDLPPVYLESRIEAFVERFVEESKTINEATLNKTIASLVKVHDSLSSPTELSSSASWKKTKEHFITKDQHKKIANYLPKVTKAALMDFLAARMMKSSPKRFKFSTHVNAKRPAKSNPSNYTSADCGTRIDDSATSFPFKPINLD